MHRIKTQKLKLLVSCAGLLCLIFTLFVQAANAKEGQAFTPGGHSPQAQENRALPSRLASGTQPAFRQGSRYRREYIFSVTGNDEAQTGSIHFVRTDKLSENPEKSDTERPAAKDLNSLMFWIAVTTVSSVGLIVIILKDMTDRMHYGDKEDQDIEND